ncbi:uncharacterized protein LOC105701045 [Orussus abietinus]|uniref:uncharacterized protein LOC105701045 n=1 Tax=Orussus abietinus TaxID=222816 RepID=UPI0006256B11|nr:uncharacterized protein LOC105701045 [Orussus abietinus]
MPRTKHSQRLKQRQSQHECDLIIRDFERQAQMKTQTLQAKCKMEIKNVETHINMLWARIPPEIRQLTFADILNLPYEEGKENEGATSSTVNRITPPVKPSVTSKKTKHTITGSDDGYDTESATTRVSRARSRNGSGMSRTKTLRASSAVKKENAAFKTPAPRRMPSGYAIVTPKIMPNTPLKILRRPHQGETAISMQGSPLLVSTDIQDSVANVNVALQNGNIISLASTSHELRLSHIPSLDEETKRHLQTLRDHLDKVIRKK